MKVTKEYKFEMEGMAHALKIAKERGVEGLEKECKIRGCSKMPLIVSDTRGKNWMDEMEKTIFETVCLMAVSVLYDKLGFRQKRIETFIDEFRYRIECLDTGYVCWEDLQEDMREQTGIDFPISELVSGHRNKLSDEDYEKYLNKLKERVNKDDR